MSGGFSQWGARLAGAALLATGLVSFDSASPAGATAGVAAVWDVPGSPYAPGAPVVALTFDDGPNPTYTPQILDVLARYQAPATFFDVGRMAEAYPDLVRQEAAAGHGVANHTWDHVNLTNTPASEYPHQVDDTTNLLASLTGWRSPCLRPPYGAIDSNVTAQLAARGLTSVGWSVDPSDYLRPGVSAIIDRVLGNVRAGSIVLFHDGGGDRSQTVAALPYIIDGIRARGLQPVSLCGPPPAPPPAPRSPVATGAHPTGEVDVFWKGADGNLWEGYWNGSAWIGPLKIPVGPIGSSPAVAVRPSGEVDVFWQGADGNLWEAFWNGRTWLGPVKIPIGPIGSPPTVTAWGHEVDVFWRGADTKLYQALWHDATGWSGPSPPPVGAIGSTPVATAHASGEVDVFWRTSGGNLGEAWWTGSFWAGPLTVPVGGLGGSVPAATARPDDVEVDVFWEGSDSRLYQAYWGSTWVGGFQIPIGPIGSPPAATSWGDEVDVFWQGDDAKLYEAFWDGTTWIGPVLIPVGPIG